MWAEGLDQVASPVGPAVEGSEGPAVEGSPVGQVEELELGLDQVWAEGLGPGLVGVEGLDQVWAEGPGLVGSPVGPAVEGSPLEGAEGPAVEALAAAGLVLASYHHYPHPLHRSLQGQSPGPGLKG